MNGGHDTALDRGIIIEGLRHGRKAVCGAGSGGDNLIFSRQGVFINAENDRFQVVARGSGDDNLLRACLKVGGSLILGGEEACALKHDVYAQLAPGELSGVGILVNRDDLAVHRDGILARLNSVTVITALGGIILEKMSKHLRAGQVVDRNDVIALGAEHLTERKAANAAKTIDCYFY